jgi:hypothetical protein
MYWSYENESVVTALASRFGSGNQQNMGFDANCLADIAAVKNAR